MPDEPRRVPDDHFRHPSPARVWNFCLGGKDNYAVDRTVGAALAEEYPSMGLLAQLSRQFLVRSVRYLAAEAGVRQFLDIGAGLPTMQNTHEVAQAVAPESKIVYVDNDPVVLAHARALLVSTTEEGATDYIDADYHDVGEIIAEARTMLDFSRPIAVLFMGVMGYVPEIAEVRGIINRFVMAVPSGSYLAMWDGTSTSEIARVMERKQTEMGFPYALRSVEELASCFDGLDLAPPGLVPITAWRPEDLPRGETIDQIDSYGAVARKP
jgi:hypothetical protein